MSLYGRIRYRLKYINEYSRLAWSPVDVFRLALLGFCRVGFLNGRNPLTRAVRKMYPSLIIRPAKLGGMRMILNPSDWTHHTIFDEIVKDNIYDLSRIPFPPEIIIDCGAHIGFFSIEAAAAFPSARVIAFEPNPDNLRYLNRQVQMNGAKVSVVPAAVSVKEGETSFGGEFSFSGQIQSASGLPAPGGYMVKLVNLPQRIAELKPRSLLLKIDIEGEEVAVIPAILDRLPADCAIFFETHHGKSGWEAMARKFADDGFEVSLTRDHGECYDGFALKRQVVEPAPTRTVG